MEEGERSANPWPQNVYTIMSRCLGNYRGLCSQGCLLHLSFFPPFLLLFFSVEDCTVAGGARSVYSGGGLQVAASLLKEADCGH